MSWNNDTTGRTITVRVNGIERPHDSHQITWAQDITSDLPATVTAGGQVATRTGNIVWQTEGVSTSIPTPWEPGPQWLPTVGDDVTIDVTDGDGNTLRVFTGVIDTVEGDAQGNRSSKIVSEVRGSNRVIRRLAQTQSGALVSSGQVGRFGTTPVWVISEICRELGYESVPPAPAESFLILDAPLQGSTYNYSAAPYANARVVTSHRAGQPTLQPVWSSGRDGFGVSNALIEWEPDTGGGSGAGQLGISLLVYAAHAEDALLRIRHGANADTYLRVLGNKTVRVSTYTGGATVSRTLATSLPAGDGPHRVSLIMRGGKLLSLVGGVEETHDLPTVPEAVTRLTLEAGAASCVAGLQVWHPPEWGGLRLPDWKPTAAYRHGTGTQATTVAPSVRDEKAGDVLSGYAEALLSPLWIDGAGALQVVTGKALHDQPVALTVDALRDVSDLSYSMALLDHRPTVEVKYAHAHATNLTATAAKTRVWQGSGATAGPGTPDLTFVNVPDDEEWVGLSDPAAATQLLWPDGNVEAFYQQTGSWWGFRYESTSTTEFMSTQVSQIVETLTPWAWKVTSSTTDPDGVSAKTPSQYSTIPPRFRDMDLPIYRARALVRYEDRTVSMQSAGATDLDGILSHDTGRWATTTSAASSLASWIHSMVSTPTPVLEGLRVRFDPRLDVGIKITVSARAVFGVSFHALVLSVDHDPGSGATTLVARVTNVITPDPNTLAAVDHAHIGQTLTAWDQARTGQTLTQVDANPYL